MNTSTVSSIAGAGFWIETEAKSMKVGVVNNHDASQVEAELKRLRERLRLAGFKARLTGKHVFTLLRVWK
jgi:hypothetical protein